MGWAARIPAGLTTAFVDGFSLCCGYAIRKEKDADSLKALGLPNLRPVILDVTLQVGPIPGTSRGPRSC